MSLYYPIKEKIRNINCLYVEHVNNNASEDFTILLACHVSGGSLEKFGFEGRSAGLHLLNNKSSGKSESVSIIRV